jgi:hypothetical protein
MVELWGEVSVSIQEKSNERLKESEEQLANKQLDKNLPKESG